MAHRPTLSLDVNSSRAHEHQRVAGPQTAVQASSRAMRPPSPALVTPTHEQGGALPFAMASIFDSLHDVRMLHSALVKEHVALENVGPTTWPAANPADGRDDGRRATAEAYTALKDEFAVRQKGVETVMGRLDELASALVRSTTDRARLTAAALIRPHTRAARRPARGDPTSRQLIAIVARARPAPSIRHAAVASASTVAR